MAAKIAPTKSVKSVRVAKNPTTIIAKVVTRNSNVELKAANSSKLSVKTPNGVKSKFGVIPKAKKEEEVSITPPQAPIRQGTFVKDEPTNENVPVVDSEETPTKTTQSKLKPPMRFNSVPAKSSPSSPKRSNLPTSVVQQLKFRSNSNASMKTTTSTPPMRSNTGINLNNPKKNVTSKIAGIWKSPLKKNQSASNSSTQLNGGSSVSTPTGNVNKRIGAGIKERIKRSSTCEEIG
jgi:adenomatosis polyposis coli protein